MRPSRCSRLHHGGVTEPRVVCPWCGGAVSSTIGREIDGYRIDEILSQGGFGIIFLASNLARRRFTISELTR